MLVLPMNFPFGGMENPCLTFVNPVLIAGDKSIANVIAHEIAHSWTGNGVTNKDWDNFWVNEGFTVFLERKISEIVNGEDLARLEAKVGFAELEVAIEYFGKDHDYTRLIPNYTDINPDEAFSVVPYEKGFLFLHHLECLVGKDNFQLILQRYIKKFMRKSINHSTCF